MIRVAFILFSFLGHNLFFAQSQKQLINFADENFDAGDYYGASIYYKKAMDIDSSSIHLLHKYATSLRKYSNYTAAAHYYQKITDKDKAGRIYKDAHFWLATMLKYNGEYKLAVKSWKKVKSQYSRAKKGYYYLKAKQDAMSCNYAKRQKNDSIDGCTVNNLGEGLNTTNTEFSPLLHDSILYFSSLRSDKIGEALEIFAPNTYKVAVYEAQKKEYWKTKSRLDTVINQPSLHTANGSFNKKGDRFYFTQCDSISNCKVFVAKENGGTWSNPTPLPEKINQKNTNTTQPHVALIDGKEFLFFVSNRKGGEGDLDIWISEILDGGTYSAPENAGQSINTPDPDITPFYHQQEKTLYFSSTWHNGFGGFDIFKSKGEPGSFNDPENLMPPINTSWNDFYYILDSSATTGYLTSNRLGVLYKKGPTCCNDIWEVNFAKEETTVDTTIEDLDDLNKYLPVTLYFHNDRPGPRSLDTAVSDNYLATYQRYIDLQSTYRKEYSKGLKDEQQLEAVLDIDDYFNHYVKKGVKDLELFSKLLLIELEKGQKIEITIKGFASPLAKTDYNVNLTKRRISTLVNYLRAYGNGEFNPYIDKNAQNGGALTFLKIPFGEYTANTNVSDDYYDQRNSVYNRKAALERKIEIQSITYADKGSIYAGLTVADGTFDFGKVKKGEIVSHDFTIENTGNKPLRIIKVVAGCNCSAVDYDEQPIPPGESTKVTVTFDTKDAIGKQVKSVTVIADAFPRTKRLILTAEVFD